MRIYEIIAGEKWLYAMSRTVLFVTMGGKRYTEGDKVFKNFRSLLISLNLASILCSNDDFKDLRCTVGMNRGAISSEHRSSS